MSTMMTSTTITFNGLMVFCRDPKTNTYQVGILRARENPHAHILQLQITPDPATGNNSVIFDPQKLEDIVQNGDVRWDLEVEISGQLQLAGGGIDVNPARPRDRRNSSAQNEKDFGWIVNLESDEFHNGKLDREPKRLLPVITLKNGKLVTTCKTDSVDLLQDNAVTKPDAGFISGALSLIIDTSAGEVPKLYYGAQKTDLLNLTNTKQRNYFISIMNVPMSAAAGHDHFHLYYDRLFTKVDRKHRFDFAQHKPISSPSDRCPTLPAPDPFRCGGISIGDDSGPLD